MESKGKIVSILSDSLVITLEGANRQEIEALEKDTDYRIELVKWSDIRSLNANKYFHVLCDKLRQKNKVSMAYQKNDLITSYGQIDYIDGQEIIFKSNIPEDKLWEYEEPHLLRIRTKEENGQLVFFYRVYRGSHTYNSKEMALLIDGTVQECKDKGIETLPPVELKRMLERWGHGKHTN